MSDQMLTDDEQLENVKAWFTENGPWLAGGLLLGVAILFGWRWYNDHRNSVALKAAEDFSQMNAAMDKADRGKVKTLAAEIRKDYSDTPYADQADLMLARLAVDSGELANAVDPLTRVMNDSKDEDLRSIARLRLARVLIDQKKPDEALNVLATQPGGAFAARMHEVRGDARLAKNDTPGAIKEYQQALAVADARGVERGLLELKLADLGVTPAAPAVAKVTP